MNKVKKECKLWKGKWVTEAVFNKRLKQVENGKKRRKEVSNDAPVTEFSSDDDDQSRFPVKGNRIVDLSYLTKSMYCQFCKKPLLLCNIETEKRRGLASFLKIRCAECLLENDVATGPNHSDTSGPRSSVKFDINSKAALGGLHTGLGHTHIEKFLRTMDIPVFTSKTFKTHEREMGKLVETVARESCVQGAKIERALTIEKAESLANIL